MRRLRVLGCLAFLLTLVPRTTSLALTVEEVAERLQAVYRGVHSFQASFLQSTTNRSLGQTLEGSGKVAMKKPGKMRWEYESPEPQLIVSDGKTLWIYTPRDRQVIVQEASESFSLVSLHFLAGKGDLRRDFKIRPVQHAGTAGLGSYLLELSPKRPEAAFARMILQVDQKDFTVQKVSLFDPYANTTVITFEGLKLNPPLPDSLFVFTPPKGVEVVRPPKTFRP